MSEKQHAVELLDRLDPGQLAAVVHLLEVMVDGEEVSQEEDSDTLSPAEAKAIAEADEWSKHNPPIPLEEVLSEFGLTMADWERMSREPNSDGQTRCLYRTGQGRHPHYRAARRHPNSQDPGPLRSHG
jgi:hypothetical protein